MNITGMRGLTQTPSCRFGVLKKTVINTSHLGDWTKKLVGPDLRKVLDPAHGPQSVIERRKSLKQIDGKHCVLVEINLNRKLDDALHTELKQLGVHSQRSSLLYGLPFLSEVYIPLSPAELEAVAKHPAVKDIEINKIRNTHPCESLK